MTNVQIYVGTYQKYNNGSIYGAWLDLENYSDFTELQKAMKELHKDEEDPEFMFQDYECPSLYLNMGLISESFISDTIYEVFDAISDFNYNIEVVDSYISCIGNQENDILEILEKVEESYNGEFDSDTDFAEEILQDDGFVSQLPSYVYIDWERTARDIMMDYATDNNHYFRMQ